MQQEKEDGHRGERKNASRERRRSKWVGPRHKGLGYGQHRKEGNVERLERLLQMQIWRIERLQAELRWTQLENLALYCLHEYKTEIGGGGNRRRSMGVWPKENKNGGLSQDKGIDGLE